MPEDNDRRVLLAIILSLGVYYLWVSFLAPPPPVVDDPATDVAGIEAPADTPTTASTPSVSPAPDPVPVMEVPQRKEAVSSSTWRGVLSSNSGGIEDLTLQDFTEAPTTQPVWTWAIARITGKTDEGFQAYKGGDDAKRILSANGALGLAGVGALGSDTGYRLEKDGQGWVAQRTLPSGVSITKRIQPGEDPHTLDITVHFRNNSGQAIDRVWLGVADHMAGGAGRFDNAAVRPEALVDGDVEHLADPEDVEGDDVDDYDGPVSWLGLGDRYFMAVLALDEPIDGKVVFDQLPDGRTGAFLVDGRTLDVGAERTYKTMAYLGHKELDLLQRLGHDLEEAVEFGFFGFFSRVLLFLLKVFQKGLVNWGLSIIALTVLVKAVFFPLTQKAFTSSKKMQALQPQLKAMQEKYKDNKELQSVETMKLFKENGVNPMGGCLPSLIQLPVWFALYTVMLNSVELYDSSFLYLEDLTAPDPYGVLAVIYAVLIIGQQRLMPMGSLDPAQQKVMKMIPLVFAFMMFGFPSGLVLYFSVNILLTVFQQWLINRTHDASQPQTTQPATT